MTDPRPARMRLKAAMLDGYDVWSQHFIDGGISAPALAALEAELVGPSSSGQREMTVERTWTLDVAAVRAGSDMARLQFKDVLGRTVTRLIPGATAYLSDGETVDELDIDVAAFIAAVLASTVTSDGQSVDRYVRGWRVSVPGGLK